MPYLIASILMTVMVMVGFLVFIVPGIIVVLVFGFYGFHIVDTAERSPIEALRRSAWITRGERLRLFGLGLVLIVLNLLGLAIFPVGVLVTAAVSLLVVAHVYRRLSATVPGTKVDDEPCRRAARYATGAPPSGGARP